MKRRLFYIVSRDSVSENIFQRWKFERWLKKNGGHTVSHKEAECAYREGKIVNLAEYCPEVFDDEYESESHCIILDEVKKARAEPSTEWSTAREILEVSLEADEEFEKSKPEISHKDLCNR